MTFEVDDCRATINVASRAEAQAVLFAERQESEMLSDLLGELGSDDVFLDVGANIGIFSLLAASKIDEGSIIAVEPFVPNLVALHRNVEANGSPTRVLELALSDRTGFVNVTSTSDEVSGIAAIHSFDSDLGSVRSERGDKLVENGEIPHPTVVKIDVEGAESAVINGMRKTLRDDRCRLVYCEIHRFTSGRQIDEEFESSVEEIERELRSMGFTVTTINRRGAEVQIKAEKRSIDDRPGNQ
jgi:FkbM family methyltransferase